MSWLGGMPGACGAEGFRAERSGLMVVGSEVSSIIRCLQFKGV